MQFFFVSSFHLRNPFRLRGWFWRRLVFTGGVLVYLNYVDVLLEVQKTAARQRQLRYPDLAHAREMHTDESNH